MFDVIIYSDDEIASAQQGVDALRAQSNLPPLEFARVLLEAAEEIAREEAQRHADIGQRIHEPDLVSLADRVAGIIERTAPQTQVR